MSLYQPVTVECQAQKSLTTSPSQLSDQECTAVFLQADPANSTNVLVGGVSVQVIVLTPGTSLTATILNTNAFYAKMASGTGNLNIMYFE